MIHAAEPCFAGLSFFETEICTAANSGVLVAPAVGPQFVPYSLEAQVATVSRLQVSARIAPSRACALLHLLLVMKQAGILTHLESE